MKRRLILGAHFDDESIGCGGTIAKYSALGAEQMVGILSADRDAESRRVRRAEGIRATGVLGVNRVECANLRAHPLSGTGEAVDVVAEWLGSFLPDLVLLPHADESDPDHAVMLSVLKNAMLSSHVSAAMLAYEIWTPLASPMMFEDVTRYHDVKMEAIRSYASQHTTRRYDDAAEGLARYRGVMTGKGMYAEAFNIVS